MYVSSILLYLAVLDDQFFRGLQTTRTLHERVMQTANRLEHVNAALLKSESDVATVRMQAFSK